MLNCLRRDFRLNALALVLALMVVGLLGVVPAGSAPPQGGPQAGSVPRGQRMFTCCHSFHCFVYPLVSEMAKAAGIEGIKPVGMSAIGGSRVIQHWDVAEEKNTAKAALCAGKVDVLTLSPIWMPDEGIEKFARLGPGAQPGHSRYGAGVLAPERHPTISVYRAGRPASKWTTTRRASPSCGKQQGPLRPRPVPSMSAA